MLLSNPVNTCYPRGRVNISNTAKTKLFGGKKAHKVIPVLAFIIVLAVVLIVFTSTSLSAVFGGGVKSSITVEAGFEPPPASAFLQDPNGEAAYITDVSSLDMRRVGDNTVAISVNGEARDVVLRVVDTTAPIAYPRDKTIVIGETCTADDFAAYVFDACEVSIFFKKAPDFTQQGVHETEIILEDTSGNKTELTARLIVVGVKPLLEVEAGTRDLDPQAFLDIPAGYTEFQNDIIASFETTLEQSQLDKPGEYQITIQSNGLTFNSTVIVADTTPPSARPIDRTICLGTTANPSFFVSNVSDVSGFIASFKTEPDYTVLGTQEVTVILEDNWGNISEYSSSLTIVPDTIPPIINGVVNQTVHLGDSVSYRNGVSASDNVDGMVEVIIDSTAVNVHREGNYTVTYSATDSSGNTATRLATITVIGLTYDMVYELADQVLASIITPDMAPAVKVQKIWRWVHDNITYAGTRERETLSGAYTGLRTRRGDCFIFYAVSEVLLNRAGFETMRVTRVGGRTNHFWNLVNVDGGWYHNDATPILGTSVNLYMFTNAQAAEYTNHITRNTIYTNYYVYDRSAYPPIVGDDELYGDEGSGAEETDGLRDLGNVPVTDPIGDN